MLQAASDVMADEAWDCLSDHDAAILVLSICLHDCGMHLTEEGFQSLISSENEWESVSYFDKKNWRQLWFDLL